MFYKTSLWVASVLLASVIGTLDARAGGTMAAGAGAGGASGSPVIKQEPPGQGWLAAKTARALGPIKFRLWVARNPSAGAKYRELQKVHNKKPNEMISNGVDSVATGGLVAAPALAFGAGAYALGTLTNPTLATELVQTLSAMSGLCFAPQAGGGGALAIRGLSQIARGAKMKRGGKALARMETIEAMAKEHPEQVPASMRQWHDLVVGSTRPEISTVVAH